MTPAFWRVTSFAAVCGALFLAGACAPARLPEPTPVPLPVPAPPAAVATPPAPQPPSPLVPVSWDSLGATEDDLAFAALAQAVRESAAFYRRSPPAALFSFGERSVSAVELALAMETILPLLEDPALAPAEKASALNRGFDLYQSVGRDGKGAVLFTGYYEPVLRGSTKPDARFRHPIYRRPPDLVEANPPEEQGAGQPPLRFGRVAEGKLIPYFTREEIDGNGALAGQGLELLWLLDPLDRFFLQVQGSGRVILEDGTAVRVLYAGKNGHPYVSLGKALVAAGKLPRDGVSLEAIRAYLLAHPEDAEHALFVNPSYTFFRLGEGGPFGNTGAVLTPRRSIATDASVFPKGALCLIRTQKPVYDSEGVLKAFLPFDRFVCNQDTGGAIVGPGRVDLFFGPGAEAGQNAGQMQQPGTLYFLAPKDASLNRDTPIVK